MPSDDFDEKLGLGKVNAEVLKRSVLSLMPTQSKINLDASEVALQGNIVVAHSPSIGVPLEALGFFAFHYAASNVAARLARPRHLVNGIYLPLETRERDLRIIAGCLGAEARKYGVDVVAGQTATYAGLEIPLVTVTCMGEPVGTPEVPEPGDPVILVGEVGGEALWLKSVSEGGRGETWRGFTPLPAALSLIECEGVKLVHDVSEGGVKGSLFEIAINSSYGLKVSSEEVVLYPGAENLPGDIMRAPSYGALIVIVNSDTVELVQDKCRELGIPCSVIGEVTPEQGLTFDGKQIRSQKRIDIDNIYGSFTRKDCIIIALEKAIERALDIGGLVDLIPEVGMNIVYAKPEPSSLGDVAGLSGRIIKAMGKPMSCGEVVYGASRHLSSVVLEAMRLDSSKRAAINIRGGNDVEERLEAMGIRVQVLPLKVEGAGCPVAIHLRDAHGLVDAYLHPGDHGIEPTTTILGEDPSRLVDLLEKMM